MRDENKSFMGPTQGFSYSHMTLFFYLFTNPFD